MIISAVSRVSVLHVCLKHHPYDYSTAYNSVYCPGLSDNASIHGWRIGCITSTTIRSPRADRQVQDPTAEQGWWLLGLGHNASKIQSGYKTNPYSAYVPQRD